MAQKLYRSKSDCMVAGVASGIARYFGLDPTLVRLIWLVSIPFGGYSVFLYLVAWVIVPPEPEGIASSTFEKGEHIRQRVVETAKDVEARLKGSMENHDSVDRPRSEKEQRQLLGWILVGLGLLFLSRNLFAWFSLQHFWPILLIVAGAVIVFQAVRR